MAKKKNINADVVVGETNIKVEKNEKSGGIPIHSNEWVGIFFGFNA